ncbi:virulence RhuM family protein [Thauera sp. WH-1]|uniref:virulence RhuM family protein n=1 Tax=Thauera sp. WH-1 TaxID=3398230 RepID=UPI0039FDD320
MHARAPGPATDIAIFEAPSGQIDVRLERDNVWLSLPQLASLFGRDKSVISRHIRNVFAEAELERAATVANFTTVQDEGGRAVERQQEHFNLDLIISVGYRVKSREGVRFRQWATRILKDHLTRGYTLDRQRLEHNSRELEAALLLVRRGRQRGGQRRRPGGAVAARRAVAARGKGRADPADHEHARRGGGVTTWFVVHTFNAVAARLPSCRPRPCAPPCRPAKARAVRLNALASYTAYTDITQ